MELNRTDYFQVEGASRGVLALLPYSQRQPLLVGDNSGSLSLLNLDARQTTTRWTQQLRGIGHVQLLRHQNMAPTDTIYVGSGSCVSSYASSGVLINSVDTCIAESISSFKVQDNELWIAGKYLYSKLVGGKDVDYLILSDLINDIEVLDSRAVLACQDKTVRVLDGTDTMTSHPLSSIPIALNRTLMPHELLYALANGNFGCLASNHGRIAPLWSLAREGREPSSILMYDFTGNGREEVIIGRSDGKVEVFSNDGGLSLLSELKLPEAVTSTVAGQPLGRPEIVSATYSGKILGIGVFEAPAGNYSRSDVLKNEIGDLQAQLESLKKAPPQAAPAAMPNQQVTYKVHLLGEEAAYLLAVECQHAIETLCLQSDAPIDIMQSEEEPAHVNVISEGNQVIAIYRYQDSSYNRVEIKFRSTEGQSGSIRVYVVSALKMGQQINIELKPLSLHEKIPEFDESEYTLNSLQVTGNFSKGEMHGWLTQALPDMPPHVQDDRVSLCYASCVLGTVLLATYTNNFAEFRSESVSIIAILKECIAQHASFRKIHLEVQFTEHPDSHAYVLELIDSQLTELHELDTQAQLIEALIEVQNQGDLDKFSDEFKQLLANKEDVKKRAEKNPKKLQFLQGLVTDLYVDLCKFRGIHSVGAKIPELQHILANYSFENLVTFFRS